MKDFRRISVYFDKDFNLIGVPSTIIKKLNVFIDITSIICLNSPYCDEELESFLKKVIELCFSQSVKECPKKSALQIFRGVKSHAASIKGLGLVSIGWNKNEGYTITPTWRNTKLKNAFLHLDNKSLQVSNSYCDNELAKMFRRVLELSTIEPMSEAPESFPDFQLK